MPQGTALVRSVLRAVASQYALSGLSPSLDCRWCRFSVSMEKVLALAGRWGLGRTAAFLGTGIAAHSFFCRRPGGN